MANFRYAVGTGSGQQLGVGSSIASYTAWTSTGDQFSFVTNTKVFDGAAQCYLAIGTGGIYGWGLNDSDALGLGDALPRNTPTLILAGTFISLAGLESGGLAVKSDGTLWGWGSNYYGELGVGDTSARTTPVQVGSDTNWAAVAGSGVSALALKTTGTIWSCGDSADGELGLGATASVTTLTQIGSGTTWASVHCGYFHCAALTTAGALWMWGSDYSGELGTAGGTYSDVPVLKSIGTVTHVALGYGFTVARISTGDVLVTGGNSYGQLGVVGNPITSFTTHSTATATKVFAGRFDTVLYDGTDTYGTGANTLYTLGIAGGANAADFTLLSALTTEPTSFAGTGKTSQIILTSAPPAPEDIADGVSSAGVFVGEAVTRMAEAANGADTLEGLIHTMWLERLHAATPLVGGSVTHASILDSAAIQDVIQQAIEQLVTDTADGAGTFSLSAASALIEIANAATIHVPSFNVVMSVAELIAAIDVLNGADGYDLTESGDAADIYAARVEAVYALLDERYIQDVQIDTVAVYQLYTDTADGATAVESEGSLINALISDTILATIYLNIGGELFTGWVLNTDTLAPSEYQFADRQFNSACKHGDKYLMASEDGIYEFTEDVGVESVMTYIKTGKSDFGSDLKKRVVNSYIVYSATGNMVLKVTTSEYGQLQTRNYRMVPPSNSETTDVRRFDIGRGVKSRYWQFELVGDGVDCDIDEIGMLPVVLSRRI